MSQTRRINNNSENKSLDTAKILSGLCSKNLLYSMVSQSIKSGVLGGIAGGFGANILRNHNYDNYKPLEALESGLVGNLVLGAAQGGVSYIAKLFQEEPEVKEIKNQPAPQESKKNGVVSYFSSFFKKETEVEEELEAGYKENESTQQPSHCFSDLIISIGLATAGGVLGRVILDSVATMSLEKTAAAMAVGDAALVGLMCGLGAAGIMCGVLYMASGGSNEAVESFVPSSFRRS
jgi:hypothetical protein